MVKPVTVRLVNGVTPPTAPVKVIFPDVPLLRLKATAPFKVLEKLMFAPIGVPPAFVVSNEVAVVTTGPVNTIMPPLVVILPLILI